MHAPTIGCFSTSQAYFTRKKKSVPMIRHNDSIGVKWESISDMHPHITVISGNDSDDVEHFIHSSVKDVILPPPDQVSTHVDKDHDIIYQNPDDLHNMPETIKPKPEKLIEFKTDPVEIVDKSSLDEAQRIVDNVLLKAKHSIPVADNQHARRPVVDKNKTKLNGPDGFKIFKRFDNI